MIVARARHDMYHRTELGVEIIVYSGTLVWGDRLETQTVDQWSSSPNHVQLMNVRAENGFARAGCTVGVDVDLVNTLALLAECAE